MDFDKPKFHLARHVTSRHETFDDKRVERVALVVTSVSSHAVLQARLSQNAWAPHVERIVSRSDEPSGIWAICVMVPTGWTHKRRYCRSLSRRNRRRILPLDDFGISPQKITPPVRRLYEAVRSEYTHAHTHTRTHAHGTVTMTTECNTNTCA